MINVKAFHDILKSVPLGCLLLTSCSCNKSCMDYDPITFLDYAASASVNEASLKEFIRISRQKGNSSGINPHAQILAEIECLAASVIAKKINAKQNQIHFANSATTANNVAVMGVALRHPGCHIITTRVEHKGILNVCKRLQDIGYDVTYLDVDRFGHVDMEQLENNIRSDTKLITIQTFNSEIGTRQNVEAIGKIAQRHQVLFHADAAQSFGKFETDVEKMHVDMLTISGYKIGAPKGIAALYVRDVGELQPILFGSGDLLFPGTKPTALIAAFAKAVENYTFDEKKVNDNFNALVRELTKLKDIYINSDKSSHVLSVSIGGVQLKDLLERIEDYSFSAGCSCLGVDQSNVLAAIDPLGKLPTCTIRISFSDRISQKTLIKFAKRLIAEVLRLRQEKEIGIGCSEEF
ncbi:MAG: aminotransferase class V-fold PLP-dependent enzyme [Holosporaceae bacterium]|nr:aminotransferase class V-fold PLP-dependent enzyme [Holosporaceae bacterium]